MLDVDRFCKARPVLYHLAAEEAWPGVQRHGVLSSNAIYRTCGVDDPLRRQIETDRLGASYRLESQEHGVFTLRDRTTLSHRGLEKALSGSCSPDQWINLLNRRVYFFAQKTSLENLRKAPYNRDLSHIVLEVDTRKLFELHTGSIEVAEINTGYTKRSPAKRSPASFQSVQNYMRTAARKIVEVTVLDAVPELLPLLRRAVRRKPCGAEELLYST